MKSRSLALLALLTLTLTACRREFLPLLQEARRTFAEENFVETVDASNAALQRWKDSDGTEAQAEAYQLLGQSYQRLHKAEKAVEAYQNAVRLSSNTFVSAYQLGMIFLTRSEPALAAKAFQAALRMKADDPLALVGLGNSFYMTEDYSQARLSYQRVIDTSPGVKESLEYTRLVDEKLQASRPRRRSRRAR